MLAKPEEVQWFKEVDTLLKEIMALEPAKALLDQGGAILLRASGITYQGGPFDRIARRIEKDGG